MAIITPQPDKTLVLDLDASERTTFESLPDGQLAEYITTWLAERFKNAWQQRINRLTDSQKSELLDMLTASLKPQ